MSLKLDFEAKQKALLKVLVLGGGGGYCTRVRKEIT